MSELQGYGRSEAWREAYGRSEAWREAEVVVCSECGARRRVLARDAADERVGGYYCEGTNEPHRPVMLEPEVLG